MLNRKRFETGDVGSNGNSEEPKGSEKSSIVNSDGLITVKLDHKFSINSQLIIDNLRGEPTTYFQYMISSVKWRANRFLLSNGNWNLSLA